MALGELRVSPWSSGLGCCGIKQALGVSFGLASTMLRMNNIGLVSRRRADVNRVKSRVKPSTKKSPRKVISVLHYRKLTVMITMIRFLINATSRCCWTTTGLGRSRYDSRYTSYKVIPFASLSLRLSLKANMTTKKKEMQLVMCAQSWNELL